MKKLAIVVAVLAALGAGWAGATWYAGQYTEQELKAQVERTNLVLAQYPQLKDAKLELLDYSKSFLGATGTMKFSAPNVPPDFPLPSDYKMRVDIKHGPVFFDAKNMGVGSARIHSELDTTNFKPEIQKQLKLLFSDKIPFQVDTDLSFGGQANYRAVVNPISYDNAEENVSLTFAGVTLDGTSTAQKDGDKQVLDGPMTGKIGKLEVKGPDDLLILVNESTLDGKAKMVVGGDILSSDMKMAMPGISVKVKDLPEAIKFGLTVTSSSALNDKDTDGTFGMQVSDLVTPILPTSQGDYKFAFKGFNAEGLKLVQQQFTALEPVQEELRLLDQMSLDNQAATNGDADATESPDAAADTGDTAKPDETQSPDAPQDSPEADNPEDAGKTVNEGDAVNAVPSEEAPKDVLEEDTLISESPEVTAKRAELEKKRDELMNQALDTLVTKVIQPNKTNIQQNLKLENKLGAANALIDLSYVGKDSKAISLAALKEMQPPELLKLVRGKVNVSLDRDLFPMAALFLEHPAVKKDGNKFVMNLELAGDKLVLNDKAMTLDEFQAMLGAGGLGGAGSEEEPPADGGGETQPEASAIGEDIAPDTKPADAATPSTNATDVKPSDTAKPADTKPTN